MKAIQKSNDDDQRIISLYLPIIRLKQGDALLPLLLNIALEKMICSVQKKNNCGVKVDEITIDVLGFAEDLNILGDKKSIIQHTTTLIIKKKKTNRLVINEEKTKVMEMGTTIEDENLAIKNYKFEKTQSLSTLVQQSLEIMTGILKFVIKSIQRKDHTLL